MGHRRKWYISPRLEEATGSPRGGGRRRIETGLTAAVRVSEFVATNGLGAWWGTCRASLREYSTLPTAKAGRGDRCRGMATIQTVSAGILFRSTHEQTVSDGLNLVETAQKGTFAAGSDLCGSAASQQGILWTWSRGICVA